jgi:archaellin
LRNLTIISFVSGNVFIPQVYWTVEIAGGLIADGDKLLEDVEKATITIWLQRMTPPANLGPNTIFYIQVMPPEGATLLIPKRTPAFLSPIMRL